MRRLCWLGVAVVVASSLLLASRNPAPSSAAGSRAARLTSELRCPTCQGLSVAASPSPAAESIRADIGRRIANGETDDGIRRAYVDRYGEWILLRPPAAGVGSIVWGLPAAAGGLAAGGLGFALWRWRGRIGWEASDDDRALVEAELARSDGRARGDA